jgi:Enoyl-(Acyl carrier protein) reductase
VVSSSAQSPVVFDDIHFTSRPYDAYCAYAQSKAATILFTVAIANRWAVDAITANALNPGGVVTNIQRHLAQATLRSIGALDEHNRPLAVPRGWKTPQQGAATSVLLAASPLVEGVTGRYFEDRNEAVVLTEPGDGTRGVAPTPSIKTTPTASGTKRPGSCTTDPTNHRPLGSDAAMNRSPQCNTPTSANSRCQRKVWAAWDLSEVYGTSDWDSSVTTIRRAIDLGVPGALTLHPGYVTNVAGKVLVYISFRSF